MPENSLAETLYIGGMTLGVSLILGVLLLVVHFFTRHMKNMLHRILIISITLCLVGISWNFFHPIIHPEFKKIDVYINQIIWIFALFSSAYLTNKLIDHYVWNRIFVAKGQTMSTSFLRSLVAGIVYAVFILMTMWLAFKKEVHHLLTLVTGSGLLLMYSGTDVIKELFAGLALNLNPAFKKGDFLKLNDRQAKIVDIDWRYVILEDITSNLMFVPNTEMLHHTIYNYGGDENPTRIELSFCTHPHVPPQMAIDLLIPQLKQLPHLSAKDWYQDNVVIHIKNCDGRSIEFAVEILVDSFVHLCEVKTIAYKIIWYTLNHHQIPLLVYNVRVNVPEKEYLKTPKMWQSTLSKKGIAALLKKSFLFSVCSKSEITMLSNHAVLHEFAPYQYLFAEGEEGDVLFLIKSGAVQLTRKMPSGDVLVIKTLKETDAIGVNTVMTGRKRDKSAVAVTPVQAYAIKRDVLKQIVDKYHERIQHLADQIMYEEGMREQDFQIYLEKKTREEKKLRQSIIGKIREFLGISNASGL